MALIEVRHPLVQHKVGILRDKQLAVSEFRALVKELCCLLTYEATKNMETAAVTVEGWAGPVEVQRIRGRMITVVPILRAGLGMLDGFLDMIPGAKVSVVGMFRDEDSLEPVTYYAKLAKEIDQRRAIILDPMLATGGTLCATIDLLKKAGCQQISGLFLVAAPEGVAKVEAAHPDVDLYVAALDKSLNAHGYILPGLGDAGDKIFGTK